MAIISMADLVTPARIIPQLRASDRSDLVRKLAYRLAADTGMSEKILHTALAGTVDMPPLMLRGGVSLLHAVADGLQRPVVALARLRNAIDLNGTEHCATDIVAALVSPATRTGDHLRALACLARRLRRPDVIAHIRATKCRETMCLALISDEWRASQMERRQPTTAHRRQYI